MTLIKVFITLKSKVHPLGNQREALIYAMLQIKFILFIILLFLIVGCNTNKTTWITVKLPLSLYMDNGSVEESYDFGIKPLAAQFVDSFNSRDSKVNIDEQSIHLSYKPMLAEDFATVGGHPFFPVSGTLKVQILDSDIPKLKERAKKDNETVDFVDNTLNFKYVNFNVQDFFTGEMLTPSFPVNRPVNWDQHNIKNILETFQPDLDANYSIFEKNYFRTHPEFVSITKEITNGAKTDEEKARKIAQWAKSYALPFSKQELNTVLRLSTNPNDPINQMTSVDYFINQRKFYCRSTSYVVKAMFDVEKIKSKFILAENTNPNDEAHMFNAMYDPDKKKWIWVDGTVGVLREPSSVFKIG
jgi:hypothetical protein